MSFHGPAPAPLPGPQPSGRRAERLHKVWAQISCRRASFPTAQMHLGAAWPPADPLVLSPPEGKEPSPARQYPQTKLGFARTNNRVQGVQREGNNCS